MTPKDFLSTIVTSLVKDADAINIEQTEDDLGTLLTLKVATEDMGAIIGRGGKTIQAIKTVLRVYGAKHDLRLNLKVVE